MARSIRIVGESWRYLRKRPRLLVLPLVSALAAIGAMLIFLPVRGALHGVSERPRDLVAGAVMALPLTFVTVFCNVGFLTMVRADQRGERPTLATGLRCATALLPAIAVWTLLSWAVGTLLSSLEQLPGIGGLVGRVLGFLGGLVWGLATFFMIPVLVVEHEGGLAGVRRSAVAFRRRWGEAVTADIGIGTVFSLLMAPGAMIFLVGLGAGNIASMLVGLVWIAPLIAVSSALTDLFTLQLYCEDDRGPFGERSLRAAVRPKQRRRWFRPGRAA